MSKYQALAEYLKTQQLDVVSMTFRQIENVTSTRLPNSKRYPAWWSNNAGNNVMTQIWLDAGFRTEQVDIAGEKLVFRRARPRGLQENSRMFEQAKAAPRGTSLHPLIGALKGTFTVTAADLPSFDAAELEELDAGVEATARMIAEGLKAG